MKHLSLFLTLAIFSSGASAQNIVWGTGPTTPTVQSDLATAIDGDFVFEVGAFRNPTTGALLTPNVGNVDLWNTHWTVADSSVFSTIAHSEPAGHFGGSLPVEDSPADIIAMQGYIWGFEDSDGDGEPSSAGSEWVLLTDSTWEFEPKVIDLDPTDRLWRVANAGEAVVGGLINNADGTVGFNTGIVGAKAVPEPSSALFLVLAGIVGLSRRRRA